MYSKLRETKSPKRDFYKRAVEEFGLEDLNQNIKSIGKAAKGVGTFSQISGNSI